MSVMIMNLNKCYLWGLNKRTLMPDFLVYRDMYSPFYTMTYSCKHYFFIMLCTGLFYLDKVAILCLI